MSSSAATRLHQISTSIEGDEDGPTPGRDVLGTAHCYKLTSELAFVRGSAYHDIPDDPIATSVAIFMFTGTPSIRFDKPTP